MVNKITQITHNPITAINSVLKKKCSVYVAQGSLEDGEFPTTKEELAAMIDESTGDFVFLGSLTSSGSSIKAVQTAIKIDFGSIPGDTEVTGDLINICVTDEMIGWVESAIGNHCFLLIPKDSDDEVYIINGITFTYELSLPVVGSGELATITLKLDGSVNKLSDLLKITRGLPTGV